MRHHLGFVRLLHGPGFCFAMSTPSPKQVEDYSKVGLGILESLIRLFKRSPSQLLAKADALEDVASQLRVEARRAVKADRLPRAKRLLARADRLLNRAARLRARAVQ